MVKLYLLLLHFQLSLTQSLLSTEVLQPHPLGSGIFIMVFRPWIGTICLFLCQHHTILTSTIDL